MYIHLAAAVEKPNRPHGFPNCKYIILFSVSLHLYLFFALSLSLFLTVLLNLSFRFILKFCIYACAHIVITLSLSLLHCKRTTLHTDHMLILCQWLQYLANALIPLSIHFSPLSRYTLCVSQVARLVSLPFAKIFSLFQCKLLSFSNLHIHSVSHCFFSISLLSSCKRSIQATCLGNTLFGSLAVFLEKTAIKPYQMHGCYLSFHRVSIYQTLGCCCATHINFTFLFVFIFFSLSLSLSVTLALKQTSAFYRPRKRVLPLLFSKQV